MAANTGAGANGREERCIRLLMGIKPSRLGDGRRGVDLEILLTSHGYPPTVSGVTLVVQRLARALVERGHRVTVLAGSDRFSPYETYDRGVHVVRLASRRNPYWPANPVPSVSAHEFARLAEGFRPDIIHCHDALPFCFRAVRTRHRLGIPLVATCHYYPSFVASYVASGDLATHLAESLTWRYAVALYQHVDEVVFATQTHRDRYVENGLLTPSRVISNGVDVERYSPHTSSEDSAWSQQLPEGPRILAVGRLAQDKNLEVLIGAIPRLRTPAPTHLLLVGEGPHRAALETYAHDVGAGQLVHFLGFVPEAELPSLYRSCDAFAISSDHEVQSIPALQAAATGLPIVAAAHGALAEICRNGENGMLVRDESPSGFADALAEVLRPKTAIRMGAASLRLARQHDERTTFERYASMYEEHLGTTRPRLVPAPSAVGVPAE